MNLNKLIQKHTWETITPLFLKIYPEAEENIEGYNMVFEKLKVMDPVETDMWLVLKTAKDGDEIYIDVSGLHKHPKTEEEKYSQGIEFLSWHKWLGMNIQEESLQAFSKQEILVHCLYEMTYVGFSEEQIQERVRKASQNREEEEPMTEEDYEENRRAVMEILNEIEKEEE